MEIYIFHVVCVAMLTHHAKQRLNKQKCVNGFCKRGHLIL